MKIIKRPVTYLTNFFTSLAFSVFAQRRENLEKFPRYPQITNLFNGVPCFRVSTKHCSGVIVVFPPIYPLPKCWLPTKENVAGLAAQTRSQLPVVSRPEQLIVSNARFASFKVPQIIRIQVCFVVIFLFKYGQPHLSVEWRTRSQTTKRWEYK